MSRWRRLVFVLLALALPLQGLAAAAHVLPCPQHSLPAQADLPPCHPADDSNTAPAKACATCAWCMAAAAAVALPVVGLPLVGKAPSSAVEGAPALRTQPGFAQALERPPR